MADTIFVVQQHHWHSDESEHHILGIVRSVTEARRLLIKTVADYLEDDGEELTAQARTIETDALWQQLITNNPYIGTVSNKRDAEKGGMWAISQESDDGNVYYFEKHQISSIPPLNETPKSVRQKSAGKSGKPKGSPAKATKGNTSSNAKNSKSKEPSKSIHTKEVTEEPAYLAEDE